MKKLITFSQLLVMVLQFTLSILSKKCKVTGFHFVCNSHKNNPRKTKICLKNHYMVIIEKCFKMFVNLQVHVLSDFFKVWNLFIWPYPRWKGSKNDPLPTFFPVTSPNVAVRLQDFLTFTFSPSPMSRSCPVLDIELELRPPLKKPVVFKSNPYKVKVMVNSLIEMLGSPNFGHFTILAI